MRAVRGWLEGGGSGAILGFNGGDRSLRMSFAERGGAFPGGCSCSGACCTEDWGKGENYPLLYPPAHAGQARQTVRTEASWLTHGPERYHIGTATLTLEYFGCRLHCRTCFHEALKATQLPCGRARSGRGNAGVSGADVHARAARQSG